MAPIKFVKTYQLRFNREEILALYETVKTMSTPMDRYKEIMAAYRKLEIAAYEASKEG